MTESHAILTPVVAEEILSNIVESVNGEIPRERYKERLEELMGSTKPKSGAISDWITQLEAKIKEDNPEAIEKAKQEIEGMMLYDGTEIHPMQKKNIIQLLLLVAMKRKELSSRISKTKSNRKRAH